MTDIEFLSCEQAAAMCKKKPATLRYWRHTGRGPKYMKVGKTVHYRREDLEEFLRASLRDPAHKPAAPAWGCILGGRP